ncbi:hypothetical protein BBJ28_00014029 [Nothophytophthora sp. Chile5]|nr:hypothetical protein BBJ28_00014029 [Nothophytophthora sp. Chile5]
MSAMVVTEHVERLSDDEVWAILHGWPDLNDDDVDLCVTGGVGTSLIALERSEFQCVTGDLRLLLCPVPEAYDASRVNVGEGIYALPAGAPGSQLWPGGAPPTEEDDLLDGVDARAPHALGRLIALRFPEAVDKTLGRDTNVFSLKHLEVLQ